MCITIEAKTNKVTIRLFDETTKKCRESMLTSGCSIHNDFVERAIEFYAGCLSAQTHMDFLAQTIHESISEAVKTSENKLARLLFKIALEMARLE